MNIYHLTTAHYRYDVRIFHKEINSLKNDYEEINYVVTDGLGNEKINNINIIDLNKNNISNGRFNRFFIYQFLVLFFFINKKKSFIHFHDSESFITMFILKLFGHKIIYDIHEDLVEDIKTKKYIPIPIRKVLSLIIQIVENFIINLSHCVVIATPFLYNKHHKKNNNCVLVRNYPLSDEFKFINEYSNRENIIVYVGGINEIRGVFEIMDSLDYINDIKLKIAGPFLNKYSKNKFYNHKNFSKVEYLGLLNRKQIVKLLNTSKVGILIGHPVKNALESLPIKLYEYMASGLPVVISNYPKWIKFIDKYKCGFYVDNFNIKDVADKINLLIKDINLSSKLGMNGRKVFKTKMNWENEYINLKTIYKL